MGKKGIIPWNFDDLTGRRFGRLTVVQKVSKKSSNTTRWLCLCDCGNYNETTRTSLIKGHSKSCGCLAKELMSERSKKYNTYELNDLYGVGYTTNTNIPFVFDLKDYKKIQKFCWYETSNNYIATRDSKTNKVVLLHQLILGISNKEIDHINRKKNDNRKQNLRIVTRQQNCINKSIQSNNKSGIVGVYWDKARERWVGSLTFDGIKYAKRFDAIDEAIEYRRILEEEHFKEYAPSGNINNIPTMTETEIQRLKDNWKGEL
mgnify:FL=1|jgi:hypothetical protein